jgi:hypothetical protein
MDLQGRMDIDALEHIHQKAVGIDALQTTGSEQTLNDANMARAHFCPTEQPVASAHRNRANLPLQMIGINSCKSQDLI